jgi:hypothetical protein
MLRKSDDIPYFSKSVTFIWQENGEWFYCHDKTTKRKLLLERPKEIMCAWTGQWSTDIFEIDFDKAIKSDL